MWFTLLLMGGLAVLLFLRPRLPQKSQPDPKHAWTLVMANFTRLQSTCDALKTSPDDAEARKRFTTLRDRCLELLNSYSDSDWGSDAAYAVKVKDEIAAMSASVRAEIQNPAPGPASGAVVPPPESSATATEREVPPPAEKPSPAPVSEASAAPPGSPATAPKPEVPTPAEQPSPVPVSETAAPQPESAAPAVKPDVSPPAEQPSPTPTSEATAPPAGSTAPAVKLDIAGPAGRRLTPYLWLPGGVEDAAAFYVSVFRNSRVVGINRYPESMHSGTWSVLTATICLDGQDLMLLNGGTAHNLPGSFQLLVRCADQAEVDYYWERLLAGGGEECTGGWLKDRFGVSWQVMPDVLLELLNDPQRAAPATEAMLKMKKIDIAALREAVADSPSG